MHLYTQYMISQIVSDTPKAIFSKSFFKRRPLLSRAVKGGNVITVSTLLWAAEHHLGDDYNRFINDVDLFGNGALHMAAKYGNTTLLRVLLEEGANPLSANRRGNTPLHFACAYANAACAEILLDSRVTPADGREVVASQAIVLDRVGETRYIDAMNSTGLTALHLAVLNSSQMTTIVLVTRGAQLDCGVGRGLDRLPYLCGGSTPLHIAASQGDAQTCLILLEAQWRFPGLELRRIRNIVGLTPLNCALLGGYHHVVRILVDTPRRERLLTSSAAQGSSSSHFPSSLRQHMLGVLQKARLLVLLRDIAMHWRAEGVAKESDSQILDLYGISNLSYPKIIKMRSLLEDEESSLRDVLHGFECTLREDSQLSSLDAISREAAKMSQDDAGAPQTSTCTFATRDTDVHEDCPICMDDSMEVSFETCGHELCFACAASLCMKPKDDIICPFCRGEVESISILPKARASMSVLHGQ